MLRLGGAGRGIAMRRDAGMRLLPTSRDRGFTVIEISIILLVLFVLAAILLPMTERFIDMARMVRAKEDVGAIGAIIPLALLDMGEQYFFRNGNGTSAGLGHNDAPDRSLAGGNRAQMLVSDGFIPDLSAGAPCSSLSWVLPVNTPVMALVYVDTLENHLGSNTPGGNPGNSYRTPDQMAPTGLGWRGAYLNTPVMADPWGNRYAVNVEFLDPKSLSCGGPCFTNDTIVLSAGPNGLVETGYQSYMPPCTPVSGLVAQGDDIIYVIQGSAQ